MKKLTLAIVPIAGLCLLFPTAGMAGLPNPSDPTIVVPKSLGGVSLGMKFKKADKAWGKNGDCQTTAGSGNCSYISKRPEEGSAAFSGFKKSKVSGVSISCGLNDKGKFLFEGPLLDFETPEGIGLGDKGSKVKEAYPKAEKFGGQGYAVNGKGESFMTFITGDGKHITSIGISNGVEG